MSESPGTCQNIAVQEQFKTAQFCLWIKPGKCQNDPENVRANPENVRIAPMKALCCKGSSVRNRETKYKKQSIRNRHALLTMKVQTIQRQPASDFRLSVSDPDALRFARLSPA